MDLYPKEEGTEVMIVVLPLGMSYGFVFRYPMREWQAWVTQNSRGRKARECSGNIVRRMVLHPSCNRLLYKTWVVR